MGKCTLSCVIVSRSGTGKFALSCVIVNGYDGIGTFGLRFFIFVIVNGSGMGKCTLRLLGKFTLSVLSLVTLGWAIFKCVIVSEVL